MSIDTKLIKQRKKLYGDNFSCIAEKWSEYLNESVNMPVKVKLQPDDVAMLMSLMKECRIKAIKEKLKNDDLSIQDRAKLNKALKDSRADRDNYRWIAMNYELYKEL